MPDLHPSGSILATGNSIKMVTLPDNGRVPTEYTITLSGTAPSTGDTTISYTSIVPAPTVARPLILEDGTILSFGAVQVIVKNDVANVAYQTITAGTSGTIKVQAIGATPPTASTTATTLGLVELLGVQGMDINQSTNLISIRSQKSGLGNEQRSTMVNFELSVSGWLHQRDYAMNNLVIPANNQSKELYVEASFADGKTYKGAAGVSNLTFPVQLDDVMKMTFTLFFQGIPEVELAS